MTAIAVPAAPDTPKFVTDALLVQLAREIAMDIHDLDIILRNHSVTQDQFDKIKESQSFQTYLQRYIQEWNSCGSTADRVKLKSLAFVEEALPQFFEDVHRKGEPLPGKAKVLEVVAKFAGLGAQAAKEGATGEKFSITINIGDNQPTVIDVTPKPQLEAEDQ